MLPLFSGLGPLWVKPSQMSTFSLSAREAISPLCSGLRITLGKLWRCTTLLWRWIMWKLRNFEGESLLWMWHTLLWKWITLLWRWIMLLWRWIILELRYFEGEWRYIECESCYVEREVVAGQPEGYLACWLPGLQLASAGCAKRLQFDLFLQFL